MLLGFGETLIRVFNIRSCCQVSLRRRRLPTPALLRADQSAAPNKRTDGREDAGQMGAAAAQRQDVAEFRSLPGRAGGGIIIKSEQTRGVFLVCSGFAHRREVNDRVV